MSLTAIEIFAGAGGAAMGLHQAGVRTLARCEWDRHACATLRAAAAAGFLDEAEVINEDVRKVDWRPYAGRADILWSSAPCQAWSSAGKRLGTADERNGWPWTFDVIDTIKPRWLIAENVMGLTHHRGDCDGTGPPEDCPADYFHRHILPECGRRFASVQWIELNASSFGVPQHRRRIFIVAGPRPIVWPKATHGDPNERQVRLFGEQLAPWVTVRQALNLDGALRPERGRGMAERHGERRDIPSDEPSPQLGAGSKGSGPRMQIIEPEAIVYRRGRDGGAQDEAHSLDESACALRGAAGGSTQPFLYLGAGIRRLTVTECAVLMAWPADYPLQGTKTAHYRQVGNGVCPPVALCLARAVRDADSR